MEPTIGWAGLSRSALRRAEAQLTAGSLGVRDEIGVLSLHTAYANRFFPGTSVQQTRLRYALFVPWVIRGLLSKPGVKRSQVWQALEQAELQLSRRLPDKEGEGTIGRSKDGPVVIPPSQSYWVALNAWGILYAGPRGDRPSRAEMRSRWELWPDGRHQGRQETDDEKRPLDVKRPLFHPRLPEPPAGFFGTGSLDFRLRPEDRTFLRTRLLETRRSCDGQPSFLAALVRAGVAPSANQHPWSPRLMALADAADREALRRAEQAAALSRVARALYNAAVEALQEGDGLAASNQHRGWLQEIVECDAETAGRLVVADLPRDGVAIAGMAGVLDTIQAWLVRGSRDPLEPRIYKTMSAWEASRKGPRRAKLPQTAASQAARAGWQGEATPKAEPIHYRWARVRAFLADLK